MALLLQTFYFHGKSRFRNYSTSPSQQVSLAIQEDLLDRPGVQVDPIQPGDIATIRFESRFQNTGGHTVQVELPARPATSR